MHKLDGAASTITMLLHLPEVGLLRIKCPRLYRLTKNHLKGRLPQVWKEDHSWQEGQRE